MVVVFLSYLIIKILVFDYKIVDMSNIWMRNLEILFKIY